MIDKGDSKNSKNISHTCFLGEPLRFGFASLASGYPLHHLRALRSLWWFRYYPSRYLTQNKPTDVVFAYF
jgi:hypothetical protein